MPLPRSLPAPGVGSASRRKHKRLEREDCDIMLRRFPPTEARSRDLRRAVTAGLDTASWRVSPEIPTGDGWGRHDTEQEVFQMFEGAKEAMTNGAERIRGNGAATDDLAVDSVGVDAQADGAPATASPVGSAASTSEQPSATDPESESPPQQSRSRRTMRQAPTEKQRRYIKTLGGDPSGVRTKQEASDLIQQRLLMRGRGPLDPARLEARGRRAGEESNGEWRSAHRSLLAGVSLELQEYLNLTVDSLRSKLSDPLGPAGSSQLSGPSEMVYRAEEELRHLELCRKYDQPLDEPSPDPPPPNPDPRPSTEEQAENVFRRVMDRLDRERPLSPRKDDRPVPEPHPGDDEPDAPSWQRWLPLASVFVGGVVVEAGLNIILLMGALPGGALAAFMLAVLISTINVGGFGITAGLFFRWISEQVSNPRPRWYWAAGSLIVLFAVGFNIVAGRHREAYARVLAQIEANPTAPVPAPRELLADIPISPLSWELEALLFALLGMFLWGWGFSKGFTFAPEDEKDSAAGSSAHQRSPAAAGPRGHEESPSPERPAESPAIRSASEAGRGVESAPGVESGGPAEPLPRERRLFAKYLSLPERYAHRMTMELRPEVADWYRALDQERRNVTKLVETLKIEQNRRSCIDTLEHAFLVAHNSDSPQKILHETVEKHRMENNPDPLAVTVPDSKVIEDARRLVVEWRDTGQARFDEQIAVSRERIAEIWDNYRSVVLGVPGPFATHD